MCTLNNEKCFRYKYQVKAESNLCLSREEGGERWITRALLKSHANEWVNLKGNNCSVFPPGSFLHFLKESFIISCDLKRCRRSISQKASFLSPRCLIWVHCCECDLTIRSSLIKHDSDHITAYFWSFQCLGWQKSCVTSIAPHVKGSRRKADDSERIGILSRAEIQLVYSL